MQDIFIQFHQHIMDADRIPVLVLAILTTMAAGMVTGPLFGNAHPLAWGFWDGFLGNLGDKMDKPERKRSSLMMRGFFLTAFALFDAYFLGKFLSMQTQKVGWVEFLTVCACLTSGAVWFALLRLYFALEKAGKAEGAYYAISRTTRIDLNSTDDFGITRTGLSLAATSFDKGMVAPALWYLIGGMPAMILYSCLAALAWRFGKSGFSAGLGAIPLALERLMGFAPTLFSSLLIVLASALTPTAKISRALKLWWAVRNKAAYEEGGAVLSTLCWLLDVTLGGPVQDISGAWQKKSWVGPEGATAQVGHKHLKRGIYINVIAHLLLILALLAMYLYAGNRP